MRHLPLAPFSNHAKNLVAGEPSRYDARRGRVGELTMLFRFIALVLIVLGLMLLGADVITLLERGEEPQMRSLADVWGLFTATGVASFQAWIAGMAPAPVAEGLASFLAWPAFAVFGVAGVILAVLFREREELGEPSY
jgi:cytochrome bd-type quinol oxidase subunit 2